MAKFSRRGSQNESFEAAVQEIKAALPSTEISEFVLEEVPLDLVDRDENQPRPLAEVMDGIEEFADELERDNFKLAQYPVFHIEDNGRWTIVIGERRTTAFKLKGRKTIPAICKRFTEEEREELFILQYAENDGKLKKELSPIADARWWQAYIDRFHGGNASKAAKARGRSSAEISNRLSLLKAPELIQEFVQRNSLRDPATFAALNRLHSVAGHSAVASVIESYEAGRVPGSLRQYAENLAREARKVAQEKEARKADPVVEQDPIAEAVPEKSDSHEAHDQDQTKPQAPRRKEAATSIFDIDAEKSAARPPHEGREAIRASVALLDKADFQSALLEQAGDSRAEEYLELLANLKAVVEKLQKAYSIYETERTLAFSKRVGR